MEKKCSKCNLIKSVVEFSVNKKFKDNLNNHCKLCMKEKYQANKEKIKKQREVYKDKINAYQKTYREANKEKIKKYREENREKKLDYMREYNHNPKVKDKAKRHYQANKEEMNRNSVAYIKSKLKTDELFRLKWSTRANISRYIKNGKSKKTRDIIGIDYKEFQDYLAVDYSDGMHLDHIIPLSWATNDEEVYILNHYSNFQIITAEDNLAKSDTYCKSENLKKVQDNHNDLTKLNKIIERNSDKIT
jgi:hypothetical protein